MRPYVEAQLAAGVALKHIVRHVLGLFHGQPGGRQFRQVLSEGAHRPGADWALVGTGDDLDLGDNPFVSYLGVTDHAIILAGQTAQSWDAIPSVAVEGYMTVGTLKR